MSSWLRVSRSFAVSGWILMLAMLALEWVVAQVPACAAVVAAPRVTLVIFADHPVRDAQWTTLAATLVTGFENLAAETHFASTGFDVVRGDTLTPGTEFEEVISVYLHGECHIHPQPGSYTVHGPLGWVLRDHTQIKPFIHVDCARIAEMLEQRSFGMDQRTRESMMADAVSRVVLHEWLHIATQNSAHAREGIFKRAFGISDLLPGYKPSGGQPSRGK